MNFLPLLHGLVEIEKGVLRHKYKMILAKENKQIKSYYSPSFGRSSQRAKLLWSTNHESNFEKAPHISDAYRITSAYLKEKDNPAPYFC